MIELHAFLSKILRDNGILTISSLDEQKRIARILDSLVKVQNQLVDGSSQFKISAHL